VLVVLADETLVDGLMQAGPWFVLTYSPAEDARTPQDFEASYTLDMGEAMTIEAESAAELIASAHRARFPGENWRVLPLP